MTDKITIFKEVFDYYYDGEITKEQLADLLLMHYETRWGNGVDVKEIEDKDLRMIWRTLQHSVIKSTKNAKQYEKQQNKKSALQDTLGTEFNITPEINNIPSNEEIENKPILTPQITQNDNQYQPEVESVLNSLKVGKNEVKQNIPIVEEKPVVKIAANKQSSDAERVQELINTDDNFCSIYTNCMKAVADYKLNSGDTVKANTKEMAMEKLKQLFHTFQIPYNKDTHNFFLNDVDYLVSNNNVA